MQRLAATEAQWRAEKARAEEYRREVERRDELLRVDGYEEMRQHATELGRERDEARAEVERLESRVRKLESDLAPLVVLAAEVNAIRNSIVGTQSLNWSEHVYPLVAALQKAGVSGLPYPEARALMGTLIERATKAEAEVAVLRDASATARHYARVTTERNEARAEAERLQGELGTQDADIILMKAQHRAALESLRERCADIAWDYVDSRGTSANEVASAIRALPLEVAP